jgi:hypothetical protein
MPDDPKSLSFDCGVDCHEFKPLTFEQVMEIMRAKDFTPAKRSNKPAAKKVSKPNSHAVLKKLADENEYVKMQLKDALEEIEEYEQELNNLEQLIVSQGNVSSDTRLTDAVKVVALARIKELKYKDTGIGSANLQHMSEEFFKESDAEFIVKAVLNIEEDEYYADKRKRDTD